MQGLNIEDCNKYADVINAKGELYTIELLFFTLILEQLKMIKELITQFLLKSKSLGNSSLYFKTVHYILILSTIIYWLDTKHCFCCYCYFNYLFLLIPINYYFIEWRWWTRKIYTKCFLCIFTKLYSPWMI